MNLLKIEWIKASNSVSFWIMIGLYILIVPLLLYFFNNFYVTVNEIEVEVSSLAQISADNFWSFLFYLTSYQLWIPVFVVIMNLSSDRNNQLWKQHIIDGLSRNEVLLSKVLFIVLLSLAVTIYVGLTGFGFILFSQLEYSHAMWVPLFEAGSLFFLCHLAYIVLGFVINLIVKNTALTLILFLSWAWFVERIIRFIDKSNSTDILPINSFNDLLQNPFIELLGLGDSQLGLEAALISTMVWLLLLSSFSWYYFKRTDF